MRIGSVVMREHVKMRRCLITVIKIYAVLTCQGFDRFDDSSVNINNENRVSGFMLVRTMSRR